MRAVPVGDDAFRGRHSERREHGLANGIGMRLSRDALDQMTQKLIARVAVGEACSRLEAAPQPSAGHARKDGGAVGQTRCVIQHLRHRDGCLRQHRVGKIFRERRIEIDLSRFAQAEDRERRERLADRSDLKQIRGRDGNAAIHIRPTEGCQRHKPIGVDDTERHAGQTDGL